MQEVRGTNPNSNLGYFYSILGVYKGFKERLGYKNPCIWCDKNKKENELQDGCVESHNHADDSSNHH
jgi:hypothetical protein